MKDPFLAPIKSKKIYEDILSQLRRLIATGQLKSGDKLPTERELAESFMVSRTSVREALRALEAMGLIRSKPGEGTFVRGITIEALIEPFASLIFAQKGTVLEVLEARKLLEPIIAGLAAVRATPEDIAQMEAALEAQAAEVSAGRSGVDGDRDFHYAIAVAAQNKVILRIVNAMVDLLSEVREEALQVKGRPAATLAMHRRVLDAIRAGDRDGAHRAMFEHLDSLEKLLFDAAKEGGREAGPRPSGTTADTTT